jgi:pimeloyl-ACP methyl ester carboxylesterase
MGGEGKVFASSLLKEAERNHWLLVSPTMAYQDWRDPNVVAREDVENSLRLAATLDALAAQTGVSIKPKALLYGFSRGAQFAHRFALFFPERVGRVAALSAGTYTLPEQKIDAAGDGRPAPAKLPYGVSDMEKALGHPIDRAQLKQVQFLVVVGEKDNVANDVPRAWDPFLGATRVERARTFSQSMEKAGVRCALKIVPDVGHEINPTMQSLAINFLREADAPLGKQAASHETR